MGCQHSGPVAAEKPDSIQASIDRLMAQQAAKMIVKKEPPPPELNAEGQLAESEIRKRSVSSGTSKVVRLGKDYEILVKYAHWTQRGYYPDDPHKENQDSLDAQTNFFRSPSHAWFAVYDGHGPSGGDCSQFVRKNLPKLLAEKIVTMQKQKNITHSDRSALTSDDDAIDDGPLSPSVSESFLSIEDYQKCIKASYIESNATLHKTTDIDDHFSGTTAVGILFHDNYITIANCGDSRAIIARKRKDRDPGIQFSFESFSGPINDLDRSKREDIPRQPIHDAMSDDSELLHDVDKPRDSREEGNQPLLNPSIVTASATTQLTSKDAPADMCGTVITSGDIGRSESLNGQLSFIALPLSRDQTPWRADERKRVEEAGARVLSIDQLEGKVTLQNNWGDSYGGDTGQDFYVDPPRLWTAGREYPGTAFTRSIGDSVAETIGCTADPELMTLQLTSNDQMLVLASDGVFEFINNQQVIDLCTECSDPIEACEKIVRVAYNQWLVYENRTDDISIIVCFIKCSRTPVKGEQNTTEKLMTLINELQQPSGIQQPTGIQSDQSNQELFNHGVSIVSADEVSNLSIAKTVSDLHSQLKEEVEEGSF